MCKVVSKADRCRGRLEFAARTRFLYQMDHIFRKLQKHISLLVVSLSVLLTGCGEQEIRDEVLLDNEAVNMAYGLTSVSVEDVVLTKQLVVTYTQEKDQEVSFNVGGRRVSKVYVNAGDQVRKGDLLVELATDGLQEQIDELEYRVSRNQKELEYLDSAQKFEEQSTYNSFVYNNPDIKEEDLKKLEDSEEAVSRNYRYKREDISDELEFDRARLTALKSQMSSARITSTMDGVVYRVTDELEGSTSRKDEVVMTIVDNKSGRFVMEEPDYASFFHEGELYNLKIVYSSAVGDYEVTPLDLDSWNEEQYFEIVSGPENDGIDVGTTASIIIELDRRDMVMALPLGAIHYADEKPYVYVLDENNFRQVEWIETGLTGDDRVEIVSGLNSGDKVVY